MIKLIGLIEEHIEGLGFSVEPVMPTKDMQQLNKRFVVINMETGTPTTDLCGNINYDSPVNIYVVDKNTKDVNNLYADAKTIVDSLKNNVKQIRDNEFYLASFKTAIINQAGIDGAGRVVIPIVINALWQEHIQL